jgi:hypothetical protein
MPVLSGTPIRSNCQPERAACSLSSRAQRQAQTAMRSAETDSGQTDVPVFSLMTSWTNQSVSR